MLKKKNQDYKVDDENEIDNWILCMVCMTGVSFRARNSQANKIIVRVLYLE